MHEIVLEAAAELAGNEVDREESGLVGVIPSTDDVGLPRYGVLLAICDAPSETAEFSEDVGNAHDVAFPVAKGALEDDPVTPPAVFKDIGSDPVPEGPVQIVELAGVENGAEDEETPVTRLDDLPTEELTPPEIIEDGRYPELD